MKESDSTRVGHTWHDDCDAYVGRGPDGRDMTETPVGDRGWLGNPFTIEEYDRDEAIEKFRELFKERLADDEEFRRAVNELQGKVLGCWCQRLEDDEPACHAEVIARYADQQDDGLCAHCDLPDVHVRLVMTTWADKPVPLCNDCYGQLDDEGKIDREADAEYFGYA